FHINEYFLGEGNSSLIFSDCTNGDTLAYPFDSCKLLNAIEIRKLPEAKKMDLFTEKERTDLDEYLAKPSDNDEKAYWQIENVKSTTLIEKEIKFVKQNN